MDSAKLIKKLENIKEQIDEADENLKRSEGKLEAVMETLKKDFHCEDIPSAEKLYKKLEKKKAKNEETLHELVEELETCYEWE